MTGNGHNTMEDLASFAMQNLPAEESASIRAHLETCATCRAELAQTYGDLALYGLSVEQRTLPEGARDRFLSKIAATQPVKQIVKSAEIIPVSTRSSRRGKGFWISWSAVAALAAACIALVVQNRALNDELNDESKLVKNLAAQASRAQQIVEVLTAPNAQRVTLTEGKAPVQPSARAIYLPERGGLILQAANLKPLPNDKTYELWVIPTNGAPVPAGLFRPDATGSATLILPPLSAGITAKTLAVTVENVAGATTPTMPIVLAGNPNG
jgi:anti-sigma-K factor RskA